MTPTPPSPEIASKPESKKLYVKTYGCQMNVYDSERIEDAMRPLGYLPVSSPDEADLMVLNTCHIREKAADKVYSELGRLNEIKEARAAAGGRTQIAVAGCVAQAEGPEMIRRQKGVDLVVGPQNYHRMPALLARAAADGRSIVDTDFAVESKFEALPSRVAAGRGPSAFLTVQEGCDKFCTFCVVPYTRGGEMSRPAGRIIEEAQRLSDQGVRELTLLGQNVNAYHGTGTDGADWGLARLVEGLSAIDGIRRIRYMTSHPRDMDDALIAAHRDNEKLMPFLHLPVQSGSDRTLAAMNRKHTGAEYLRLIDRVRTARADIALSTDIIVGFPGETEADFEATLGLIRAVGYAMAYTFKYSPRPGTPAEGMQEQVPEPMKTDRLARAHELLTNQQMAFNAACIGRTLHVLFEKKGRNPGQLIGRSPYLQSVHASATDDLIGQIVPVAINFSGMNSLGGDVAVYS